MTKRARTFIFIFFVFLFFLTAPSAVFYSQGYRVDFEAKKIVKTGGFYFRVMPGRAEVYIDEEFKKSTSMIGNSAFIEDLLPKTYGVEIKKEGYHSWTKNLEIKEKEVTEAENIILFPENPTFAATDQPLPRIAASATSTDKEKVIETDNYEIWVIFPEKEKRIFLTRFSEKISDVFWLTDYYLIFSVGDKIKIAEIDNRDELNIVDLAEFPDPEIIWDKNSKKLYVASGGKTHLLENLLP